MREYVSIEAARRVFDEYARIEPRLTELWDLCQRAAPPAPEDDAEDAFDVDLYDVDEVATARSDDGWCAEDYFFDHVKSKLLLLVGLQSPSGPEALRTTEAYDAIYAALLEWALVRPCACCNEPGDDAPTAQPSHDDRSIHE